METPQYSYAAIATGTTTVVSTGRGTLHTLVITGGTAGTIIAYDNIAASGTMLANFASTNTPASYVFDVTFSKGLTIVTGAATNLTVSYYQ